MEKKSSDYLAKGLMLTLILIVIDLIGGFAHLRFESWFKWISTLTAMIAIIVFCIQFAKQQVDAVTFGKVFGYGFKISLIVSALMVVYSLLSIAAVVSATILYSVFWILHNKRLARRGKRGNVSFYKSPRFDSDALGRKLKFPAIQQDAYGSVVIVRASGDNKEYVVEKKGLGANA